MNLRFLFIPTYAVIAFTALNMTDYETGLGLWAAWTVYPACVYLCLAECIYLASGRKLPAWSLTPLLVFLSASAVFMTGECALWAFEQFGEAPRFVMPHAWELKPKPIQGAPDSFMWQGAFHLKDPEGFRKAGEWPARDPHTQVRILVVGDSLTYGLGVPMTDTYPAQLQELLPKKYEVLNLGIVGLNSTQILNILIDKIPVLKPDLIIYGICLNDVLPVERAQEKADDDYSPPIPYWLRDPLMTRTRLGKAMDTGYNKLLLTLGLRRTFIADILAHPEYQARFQDDLARMTELTHAYNLPPIIGMVLDQYPSLNSPSHQLAEKIEAALPRIGFNPVYTYQYYREHNGEAMFVSPWEGHPSKVAYAIWAKMLARHIASGDPEFKDS